MQTITVNCYGDSNDESYDGSEIVENSQPIDEIDAVTGFAHYKLKDLPGSTAIFSIKFLGATFNARYHFEYVDEAEIRKFISAMECNSTFHVSFRPGSNQDAWIRTHDGMVEFGFDGAGGDEPTGFELTVPNAYCMDAFRGLL
jgi:hypothetical protein